MMDMMRSCVSAMRVLLVAVILLAVVSEPAYSSLLRPSATTIPIVVNRGVGRARLGMVDSTAKRLVGLRLTKSGRDRNYAGRLVYYFYFGRRLTAGYQVQMYSNRYHKVWLFAIYTSICRTSKGIHVGSTEGTLKRAYGRALHKRASGPYTRYYLGALRGVGTDFYVRNSTHRVKHIYVRNW